MKETIIRKTKVAIKIKCRKKFKNPFILSEAK
jgi:hypothetical protein